MWQVERMAQRNEGLVQRMSELELLRSAAEAAGDHSKIAEHRLEIERLQKEGVSMKERLEKLKTGATESQVGCFFFGWWFLCQLLVCSFSLAFFCHPFFVCFVLITVKFRMLPRKLEKSWS